MCDRLIVLTESSFCSGWFFLYMFRKPDIVLGEEMIRLKWLQNPVVANRNLHKSFKKGPALVLVLQKRRDITGNQIVSISTEYTW